MKEYVLGFAFSKDKQHVVLIEKQKPDWQKGKYNGVGGKIEPGEDPEYAMVREFNEETGISLPKSSKWKHFATMNFSADIMGGSAKVHCFRAFSDLVYECKTIETEKIKILSVDGSDETFDSLHNMPIIKNLLILIPMALDADFEYAELTIN